VKKKSKRSAFAVCVDNRSYPASLEAGKLYEVVPDAQAAKHGLIRVIDESGEDYGYSSERFFVLGVPHALEKMLRTIPARRSNLRLKSTTGARSSKSKGPAVARRSRIGA
jgi:hypothetical protein